MEIYCSSVIWNAPRLLLLYLPIPLLRTGYNFSKIVVYTDILTCKICPRLFAPVAAVESIGIPNVIVLAMIVEMIVGSECGLIGLLGGILTYSHRLSRFHLLPTQPLRIRVDQATTVTRSVVD